MSGTRAMRLCIAAALLGALPATGAAPGSMAPAPMHWQVRAVESLPLQVIGGDANRARWSRDDTAEVLVNNPVGLVALPIYLGMRKLVRQSKARRAVATAAPSGLSTSSPMGLEAGEALRKAFATEAAGLAAAVPPAPVDDVTGALTTLLRERGARIELLAQALPRPMPDPTVYARVAWAEEADARHWYRLDHALPTAGDTIPAAADVLEVGMLRYHLKGGDRLLLEIGVKRIDPMSGRVIGRAKAVDTWKRPRGSGNLPDLVEGDPEFDHALQSLSAALVGECARQLALPAGRADVLQLPAGTSHNNAAPSTKR